MKAIPNTKTEQVSDLKGKLARYTTLAGAAGLAGVTAQAGTKVYTPSAPGNTITAPQFGAASLWFDFEFGTVQSTSFAGADFELLASNADTTGGENYNYFYAFRAGSNGFIASVASTSNPAQLATGDPINATQSLVTFSVSRTKTAWLGSGTSGGGGGWGNWGKSGRGFLGLVFDIGGNTYYGWADVELFGSGTSTPSLTLHQFAYNTTPDTEILAGQVPEPESMLPMALLALGAAGLTRYRRQRAAGSKVSEK